MVTVSYISCIFSLSQHQCYVYLQLLGSTLQLQLLSIETHLKHRVRENLKYHFQLLFFPTFIWLDVSQLKSFTLNMLLYYSGVPHPLAASPVVSGLSR